MFPLTVALTSCALERPVDSNCRIRPSTGAPPARRHADVARAKQVRAAAPRVANRAKQASCEPAVVADRGNEHRGQGQIRGLRPNGGGDILCAGWRIRHILGRIPADRRRVAGRGGRRGAAHLKTAREEAARRRGRRRPGPPSPRSLMGPRRRSRGEPSSCAARRPVPDTPAERRTRSSHAARPASRLARTTHLRQPKMRQPGRHQRLRTETGDSRELRRASIGTDRRPRSWLGSPAAPGTGLPN